MKPTLSRINRSVFAITSLIFIQVASSAFSQYITASGAGDILDFYSPVFISGGPSVTSDTSPAADILNPAVSAGIERINLDLSVLGLVDLNTSSTSFGTVINLGLSIPTNSGVWGLTGHYVGSELSLIDLGPMASLNLSFAKEFFEKTYFGAGVGFQMGTDSDSFAWGLGLDLGMLQLLGKIGYLHDVRWGLAFRGIGKGYKSDNASYSAYPAPFTPAIGLSFFPVSTEQVSLKTQIDLWAPSLGDLRFDAGLHVSISDFFVGRVHFPFSLIEGISNGSSRIPISFGVSLQFKTDLPLDTELLDLGNQDWSRSEVNTHFVFTPVRSTVWAIGTGTNIALGVVDEKPPIIDLDIDPIVYCSPNFDGIQDALLVPLTITDERLVMGYRFIITDDQGSVVREIRNKDQRPENQGFEGLVDRLLYTKSGVTIPARLRWDGTDHKGQIVVDGTYNYYVEAWDDNGNLSKSTDYIVEIDNEVPLIEATPVSYVFSPNGDGNKDNLVIEQKGSLEDFWEAEVLTSRGKQVVKFTWIEEAPTDFSWDGRTADDFLAFDGVYSYRITSTDLAGNSSEKQINNIIIDTQATPILVSVDKAEISPNADNIQDYVNYTFQVPVNIGIESWQFVIKDDSNFQVRNYSGESNLPGFIVFDGLTDDQEILPEGIYSALLSIVYQNGNQPRTEAPLINIDITEPFAAIKGDLAVFSPDSDGNKDMVKIFQETSEEVVWNATLQDESDGIVLTKTWRGSPDETFVWNGRKADGLLAADGVYSYFLEATDRAGNTGRSNLISVELDKADTPIFITTDNTHFSPNADGVADRILFLPRLNENTGIDRYSLDVIRVGTGNIESRIVRSFRGRGEISSEIIWDGLEDNGSLVEDGQYFAELEVLYLKGNNPIVRTSSFTVDTIYPTVQLIADYLLFSPDGDSRKDTILVSQLSSNEVLWEGEILNNQKAVVRSFYWKGKLSKFEWDGKDENGNQLSDGVYSYQVAATDLSGNKTSALLQDIKMDTRKPLLFITLDTDGFSPNNDNYRDSQTIGLVSNLNSGIKRWKIDFIHESYGIQRSIVGTGIIPERFPWDGQTGQNLISPDGLYQVEVMIEYLKGNLLREKTTKFRLDTLAPKVNIKLSPEPFSPDNDGVNDELTIGIEVDDISPIAGWIMVIYDPTGSLFTSFKGRGRPSKEIIWNGLSDSGELVQSAYDYTLAFFIQDDLGNEQEIQKIIPVDVLVIRDGNDLKIRISSITFPPNSADLAEVTGEKAYQNSRTLARLGEIFEKYGRYTILIEGHANQMKYLDTVAEQLKEQQNVLLPLSEERAEAVKQELVLLGITNERMSTGGIGALKPIVPFADQKNRWKNRRVEFILTNR